MDGRDALPGAASDGAGRIDQVALGEGGKRAEAEILFDQRRRQEGAQAAPRTLDAGSLGPGGSAKGTTCLISTRQSRNGGGGWRTAASSRPPCWTNWKATCARRWSSRCGWDRV